MAERLLNINSRLLLARELKDLHHGKSTLKKVEKVKKVCLEGEDLQKRQKTIPFKKPIDF